MFSASSPPTSSHFHSITSGFTLLACLIFLPCLLPFLHDDYTRRSFTLHANIFLVILTLYLPSKLSFNSNDVLKDKFYEKVKSLCILLIVHHIITFSTLVDLLVWLAHGVIIVLWLITFHGGGFILAKKVFYLLIPFHFSKSLIQFYTMNSG